MCKRYDRMLVLTCLCGLIFVGQKCRAAEVPPQTTFPITINSTIEAGKSKVNDPIWAKTIQVVVLPDGTKIPSGSIVTGHIVSSIAFHFDTTPYATQKPSVLSISFDSVQFAGRQVPIHTSVRAIANVLDVDQAMKPNRQDDPDALGTMVQIGGDHYFPNESSVFSNNGNIVAYNRKQGVFAHLISSSARGTASNLSCDGSTTEQSVAVFSADACGLYGFVGYDLVENGQHNSNPIELKSNQYSVKIYAHTAFLLEEN